MHYRFDKTAIWHKAIPSNDNEQLRPGVKGVKFRCFEAVLKSKGFTQILQGATGGIATLALQTDDQVAREIESEDTVEYGGYEYRVISVAEVKGLAFRGHKEYVISLG